MPSLLGDLVGAPPDTAPAATPPADTPGPLSAFWDSTKAGLWRSAAGINSAVNAAAKLTPTYYLAKAAGYNPDDLNQNAYDVAQQADRDAAAGAKAHPNYAKVGNFLGGSVGYLNPITAPLEAAGTARNDVLATTSPTGELAQGNQAAANTVGLAAGGMAALAPFAGRAISSQVPRYLAPVVTKPLVNAAVNAAGYTAPEPMATSILGDLTGDKGLQDSGAQQLRDLPANVLAMTALGAGAHALGAGVSRIMRPAAPNPQIAEQIAGGTYAAPASIYGPRPTAEPSPAPVAFSPEVQALREQIIQGRNDQDIRQVDQAAEPARQAAAQRVEQPYPGAKRAPIPPVIPTADDILAMPPKQRSAALQVLAPDQRMALVKATSDLVAQRKAQVEAQSHIHPFNQPEGPTNASKVRGNQKQVPQQGNVAQGVENPRSEDLQRNPQTGGEADNGQELRLSPHAQDMADDLGVTVDTNHHIPLFGGISRDGKTVYLDKDAPHTLTMDDGTIADVVAATIVHETAEHGAMEERKSYPESHDKTAVPAENAYLESMGINPVEYNSKLKASIDSIADRSKKATDAGIAENIPDDLHPKHVDAGAKEGINPAKPSKAKRAARARESDVLDAIQDLGGVSMRSKEATGGEYDGVPNMPLAHKRVVTGKMQPDQMAKLLHDNGIGDGHVDTMWQLMGKASKSRLDPRLDEQEPGPVEGEGEEHGEKTPPTEYDLPPVEPLSGIAPGERINKHPEKANPGRTKAERDAWIAETNQRVNPVRTDKEVQLQADSRRTDNPEGEFQNIIHQYRSGRPLTDVETRIAKDLLHDWYADPARTDDRKALQSAYLQSGTEAGRGIRQRIDDVESPGERGAKARVDSARETVDSPRPQTAAVVEKIKKQIDQVRKAKAKSDAAGDGRFDPLKKKLDAEFSDLLKRAKSRFMGHGPAGANLFLNDAYDLLMNRIKRGAVTFADAALSVLEKVPQWRKSPDAMRALQEGWERARKEMPHLKLDQSSDPATLIHARRAHTKPIGPKTAAEMQSARLQRRLDTLNKALDRAWELDAKQRETDKEFFKKEGFDLDNPKAPAWQDPKEFARFTSLYESRKVSWKFAVANNAILGTMHSSLYVLPKKITSDVIASINGFARSIGSPMVGEIEHALAGGVDVLTGSHLRESLNKAGIPRLGEIPHVYSAIGTALDDAFADAWTVAKGGTSEHEYYGEHARVSPLIAKTMKGSNARKAAQIVGYASELTPVRIIHSLMFTTAARLKVAAHAYRTAVDAAGDRLHGAELEQHMRAQIADTKSESWQRAIVDAQRATFTEKLPGIFSAITRWKATPGKTALESGLKLAAQTKVPFLGIPVNKWKQTLLDWTPIVSGVSDFLRFVVSKDADGNKYLSSRDIPDRIVQAGMRWGLGATVAGMISSVAPDGLPRMTGHVVNAHGNEDKDKSYTVWINGHRRKYLELGAFGPGMGLYADYYNGALTGKKMPEVIAGIAAMGGEHQDPLTEPITRMVNEYQYQPRKRDISQHLESMLAQELGSTTGALVPSFVRQMQNATRNVEPDYSYRKSVSVDFWNEVKHGLQSEALPATLPDKIRGNVPVEKDHLSNPVLTIFDRLFDPMKMAGPPTTNPSQ